MGRGHGGGAHQAWHLGCSRAHSPQQASALTAGVCQDPAPSPPRGAQPTPGCVFQPRPQEVGGGEGALPGGGSVPLCPQSQSPGREDETPPFIQQVFSGLLYVNVVHPFFLPHCWQHSAVLAAAWLPRFLPPGQQWPSVMFSGHVPGSAAPRPGSSSTPASWSATRMVRRPVLVATYLATAVAGAQNNPPMT